MGCANSKLDDLPAVALCRERCRFLDDAIRQRYCLSQAHHDYIHSLKNVGASLNRFFHQEHLLHNFSSAKQHQQSASPLLNLPPHRKGDPPQSSSPPPPHLNLPKSNHLHHHSQSNSGSHLHLPSDDDDDDSDDVDDHLHLYRDDSSDGSGPLHHQSDGPSSPLHPPQYAQFGGGYPDTESFGLGFPGSYPPPSSYPAGGTFVHRNFMRKQTTPSVTYQQRPMNPEIVRMGGEASSSSDYPYPPSYASQNVDQINPSFYPPLFNYSNYGGSGYPGSYPPPTTAMPYYGSSSAPPIGPLASTSKEPPPPPSPPRASAWEFLNPFESYDKYYSPYTPGRDLREVREEEGIPDLEEEDHQQEVVKEVHGNQKFVDGSSSSAVGGGRLSYSKATMGDEEERKRDNSEALYGARPSVGMESDAAEYEVHMVDKKVVDDEERSGIRSNVAGFKNRGGGFNGDSGVLREIQVQFERASESGNELAKILEVGKLPYNRKHPAYQGKRNKLYWSFIFCPHSTLLLLSEEVFDP